MQHCNNRTTVDHVCVQSVICIVSTTSRKHNVLTAARECSRGFLANTAALRTDRATRSQRFMHTQVTAVAHGASHTCVLCFQKSTVRKLTKVFFKDPGVRTCATKAGKKVMTFITNRESCCAFRETQTFSRVSVTRCSDIQLCQLAQVSTETPKLLKGHRRRTAGGQMGGSPKALTSASGRGNKPAGGDPTMVARGP